MYGVWVFCHICLMVMFADIYCVIDGECPSSIACMLHESVIGEVGHLVS